MSVVPFARAEAAARTREMTITLLGATGSIGTSTIDLVRAQRDRFRIEAVTAHRNAGALARLARDLGAKFAVVADPDCYGELKDALAGSGIEAAAGAEATVEAAERPADWVMASITGAAGLRPTLTAVERGATVALANKECLVCAGTLFMRRAAATGAIVLPVDSEHNAIFQALSAGRRDDVSRLILTASGGPFRTASLAEMRAATVEQALAHPNWSMGAKVTIDSATMMNKGLELIEAHHLFGFGSGQIDIVVHPQSIVHGIVEYRDGSMIAQLGPPDMRVPIANCLAWPERMPGAARLAFRQMATLTFEPPDPVRFPALALAREALVAQNGAPTVLNAANEVAVHAFIGGRLGFAGIAALVEATIENAQGRGIMREPVDVDDAIAVDHSSRALAQSLLPLITGKAI
ncbi:MAG TPA: 1-deoxy-D-xylulose-5-phosphate reductoisomerase [Xanthobacteraceae bacterium]|nr:1-deoxy-D-xylulose-5-phosphate reductoisomerase [Xanthobacteraceae bacterium]